MIDSLGSRAKKYEFVSRQYLSRRTPVLIRVDGKSFHSLTRKIWGKNKYNQEFVDIMAKTAQYVQSNIQGCDFAYGQSDEITFLLTDYRTISTDAWFDYSVNKMVSISAALATAYFNTRISNELATFDSRAFSVPQDDVANVIYWRQLDATRNAIQMAGREHFTHKELDHKSCDDIQEILFTKRGINFNDYPTVRKRGYCIINGEVDFNIPIFSKDRDYIERFVNVRID